MEQKPVYEGTSTRSETKPRYLLVNPQFERLIAEAMALGEAHHGTYNYREGGVGFIGSCYDHLRDHVAGILEEANMHALLKLRNIEELEEDSFRKLAEHIGHAAANLNMLTYFLYRDGHLDALGEAGIYPTKEETPELPEEILETSPQGTPVPFMNALQKFFSKEDTSD